MKNFIFLLLFVLTATVFSQQSFPESWVGNYEGDLEIFTVDSVAMKLKMKLDIQSIKKDSVYKWKLTYIFKGEEDIRDYELKLVDKKKGHYQVDEKNSIVIDAYHRHNTFTSYFEVNKSSIIASYQKKKNSVLFDIIATESEPISTTGGSQYNGEEVPEVMSFKVNGRQQAVLDKIKK